METVWEGKITPEYDPVIQHWDYAEKNINLEKGQELGRFNMGSTVVLVTPDGVISELGKIQANTPIKMGQHLAKYSNNNNIKQQHDSTNESE